MEKANLILFDGPEREDLLPLTFTRPVCDLRCGILTLREKWEKHLGKLASVLTVPYLSAKYPVHIQTENNLLINGSYLPDEELIRQVNSLKPGEGIFSGDKLIAALVRGNILKEADLNIVSDSISGNKVTNAQQISHSWEVFTKNGGQIEADFKLLTTVKSSQPLDHSVQTKGLDNIFIEEGANAYACIINAEDGPVYIGKGAEIMEGSVIRGSLAMCEHSVLKMGAKIYGPTTIGPHSKVGGEVNNSVITGYSNKAHDGFLGNSVLGEWCNIGADSNNSNLKNNYAEVKLWSYREERFVKTGEQFCGLIMGDHSKCGINTMFNTGTVVGVFANLFGSGFPRNFIPSFSWGGAGGFTTYQPAKAYEVAELVMQRRDMQLSEEDRNILEHIFKETKKYRN